ncbi:MAG: putative anti-sigma regulatory factor, serine/threonine protein kinase [Pelosinus sp.]|jgi:serine/threonine-protein kinase RsbW|nr:putative anti-sigma regulatory factor, serine/threonine protein kinase [Pelosinus sp.]
MYSFSSLAEFATLRDTIRKELIQDCEEDALRLFIAINEGVNNAIFHGNKKDVTKKVQLIIEKSPDEIQVIIRDEGDGFVETKTSDAMELWNEDGRGLDLIGLYVDSYWRNAKGNEITLVKKISPTYCKPF